MAQGSGKTTNWRLSRIDEHMEKLHFSTANNHSPVLLPGAKGGTLPRRNPQTAWDNDLYSMTDNNAQLSYNRSNSSSTPNLDNVDDIYSKAVVKPAYSGDKLLDTKHAVKVITGKYDSLGRLKSLPPPEPLLPPRFPTEHVLPPSPFGSAEFPPPPPEGYAPVPDYTPPDPHDMPPFDPHPPPTSLPATAAYRGPPTAQVLDDPHSCLQEDCSRHVPTITEQEILQVEMFYRSHKTEVFVCQSLANLYFGTIRSSGTPTMSPCRIESSQWQFFKSGIPVLVLDSGNSRRKRKLNIGLAERGTGFSLWKDAMNHLTSYSSPQSTFHTMHLSNDHTRLAGFRFVDSTAAVDFYHKIFKLVSDPNDDILNLSGKKGKKSKPSKDKKKYKAPIKADISTPCCFTHITKLDRADGVSMMASGISTQKSLPSSPSRPIPPTSMTASYS